MTDIRHADAMIAIVDKHVQGIESFARDLAKLGPGWQLGIDAWQGASQMRYALLAAYNRKRLAQGAPLAMLAANDDALRLAVQKACGLLEDAVCAWVRCLTPDTLTAVDTIIKQDSQTRLQDVEVGGHA